MSNNKSPKKLLLKITTPKGIFLEKKVDEVVIPGSAGYFGVMYGHTAFLTSITSGSLEIYSGEKKDTYIIHNGFSEVNFDEVRILTETIEKPEDIDKKRAIQAKERAKKRLKEKKSEINFRRAEFALKRAIARLEVAHE
ncbi:MAG: F0F1 ATP synthase subunit epsilon [Candidatus Cloacimonetes bacterium]|nr:F0F1 ATP synthase subunit epsilon [Candidatus Cloacimonadota bacterium]MBL7107784.1 F0F1 ATP synthase subunit epsilon [Candidatus Cloacimonadota bacterium]